MHMGRYSEKYIRCGGNNYKERIQQNKGTNFNPNITEFKTKIVLCIGGGVDLVILLKYFNEHGGKAEHFFGFS